MYKYIYTYFNGILCETKKSDFIFTENNFFLH